jgi:hypothetical protein
MYLFEAILEVGDVSPVTVPPRTIHLVLLL